MRQAHHGPDEGAVFAEPPDVGQRRVIENALRQDNAQASARFQQRQATLDKEDFGLDLPHFPLAVAFGQIKQARNRFSLGGSDTAVRFAVGVAEESLVFAFHVG